jgi:hypothetical protein
MYNYLPPQDRITSLANSNVYLVFFFFPFFLMRLLNGSTARRFCFPSSFLFHPNVVFITIPECISFIRDMHGCQIAIQPFSHTSMAVNDCAEEVLTSNLLIGPVVFLKIGPSVAVLFALLFWISKRSLGLKMDQQPGMSVHALHAIRPLRWGACHRLTLVSDRNQPYSLGIFPVQTFIRLSPFLPLLPLLYPIAIASRIQAR